MLGFLKPRYRKEGLALHKHATRLLRYRKDILRPEALDEARAAITRLEGALRSRDKEGTFKTMEGVEAVFKRLIPAQKDAAWRENVEVFLVAIVLALGVRAYFLQPFTIPTGSMQPTLNGIVGTKSDAPLPNPIIRLWDQAVLGKSHFRTVAKADDEILKLGEKRRLRFFTYTEVQGRKGRYSVPAPLQVSMRDFGLRVGMRFKRGDVIAAGRVAAGDHVFVDKTSYHFTQPKRDDVFVFKTTGIKFIEHSLRMQGLEGSQYYIKRLVGLPGDRLRVDPPSLFVNGKVAGGRGSRRVMAAQGDYKGYSPGPEGGLLSSPAREYRLPNNAYFAMGDNSYNSSDSRFWGPVPELNLTGRGLFVYWPFGKHWGLIR
jgi:signal peptidase I